jgi:hypothetical protein
MKCRYLTVFEVVIAMLFNGCQTTPDPSTAQLKDAGKSPAYIEGYDDGCKSGYFVAGASGYKLAKDITRFNYDTQYVAGWNDGYIACKARYQGSNR